MVNELLKYAKKPEGPLQILQAGLEVGIQLVVHTLHAYRVQYLQLPQGQIVSMTNLGYEATLCNMALVNAASAWDGFKGNIVRAARANGHSFSEQKLSEYLKNVGSSERILEPLARRHCIVHNLARVDQDYKEAIPSTPLDIGDSFKTDLSYLKDSSVAFFETGVGITQLLVRDSLLPDGQQKPIHEGFQRDPVLGEPRAIRIRKYKKT